MKSNQVLALLGAPERVDAGAFIYWRWESAEVYFDPDGRLAGWSEPRQ